MVLLPHEAEPASVTALTAVDGRQPLEWTPQRCLVPPEEGRLRRHGPNQSAHLPDPQLHLAGQEWLVLLAHPPLGVTNQGQERLQGPVAVLGRKALEPGVPAGDTVGERGPVGDLPFEV